MSSSISSSLTSGAALSASSCPAQTINRSPTGQKQPQLRPAGQISITMRQEDAKCPPYLHPAHWMYIKKNGGSVAAAAASHYHTKQITNDAKTNFLGNAGSGGGVDMKRTTAATAQRLFFGSTGSLSFAHPQGIPSAKLATLQSSQSSMVADGDIEMGNGKKDAKSEGKLIGGAWPQTNATAASAAAFSRFQPSSVHWDNLDFLHSKPVVGDKQQASRSWIQPGKQDLLLFGTSYYSDQLSTSAMRNHRKSFIDLCIYKEGYIAHSQIEKYKQIHKYKIQQTVDPKKLEEFNRKHELILKKFQPYLELEEKYNNLFLSPTIEYTEWVFKDVNIIDADSEDIEVYDETDGAIGVNVFLQIAICMRGVTAHGIAKHAIKVSNIDCTRVYLEELKEVLIKKGCLEKTLQANLVGGCLPLQESNDEDFPGTYKDEKRILARNDPLIKGVRLHASVDAEKDVDVVMNEGKVYFSRKSILPNKDPR